MVCLFANLNNFLTKKIFLKQYQEFFFWKQMLRLKGGNVFLLEDSIVFLARVYLLDVWPNDNFDFSSKIHSRKLYLRNEFIEFSYCLLKKNLFILFACSYGWIFTNTISFGSNLVRPTNLTGNELANFFEDGAAVGLQSSKRFFSRLNVLQASLICIGSKESMARTVALTL